MPPRKKFSQGPTNLNNKVLGLVLRLNLQLRGQCSLARGGSMQGFIWICFFETLHKRLVPLSLAVASGFHALATTTLGLRGMSFYAGLHDYGLLQVQGVGFHDRVWRAELRIEGIMGRNQY